MKSLKNYVILFFALVSVISTMVAWKEHQERAKQNQTLAELKAGVVTDHDRADFQKQIWDAEKRAKAAEDQLAQQHPSKGNASSAAGETAGSGNLMNNWLGRMNDPEVQRLMNIANTAQVDLRYAALFAKLNLPPDQLAKFKALLLEKQTANLDVMAAATQQGISDPQEFQQLLDSTQADLDEQIKAALGDAANTQFQNFQQTQAQRELVNKIQQVLNATPTPLTSAQSDQLVQILAQTGPPSKKGDASGTADAATNNNPHALITDATIAKSRGLLQPPQLQVLAEVQQMQQAQRQLKNIVTSGGASNGSGTATSGKSP